jgi:hypothetical protein
MYLQPEIHRKEKGISIRIQTPQYIKVVQKASDLNISITDYLLHLIYKDLGESTLSLVHANSKRINYAENTSNYSHLDKINNELDSKLKQRIKQNSPLKKV